MRLKIPPVVVVLIIAVLMWGTNVLTKEYLSFSFEGQQLVSRCFFVLCSFFVLSGIYAFFKFKTTVDPMKPEKANKLVTVGVYHITRNPMYVGMLLLLTGLGIKLANPLNFLMLLLFIWFISRFQIKPEEEALKEKFGASYETYCKKVRRWI